MHSESFAPLSPEELEKALKDWAQHAPDVADAEAEIARCPDELIQKQSAYVQTLHPFLQMYYQHCRFGQPAPQQELDDLASLRAYFSQLSFIKWHQNSGRNVPHRESLKAEELKNSLSDWGKSLLERYKDEIANIDEQDLWACMALQEIEQQHQNEVLQRLKDAFWARYGSADAQYQAGYVLAQRGFSTGTSGFHSTIFSDSYLSLPFSFCGWAGERSNYVGFRIEKRCFCGRDAQLYYVNDDSWPRQEDEKTLETIRHYSSGLADVHYEQHMVTMHNEKRMRTLIVFRLSPDTIRETVRLNNEDVPTADLGGYVFVLPRCGEFACHLGEIQNGELVPLHQDDYCMK